MSKDEGRGTKYEGVGDGEWRRVFCGRVEDAAKCLLICATLVRVEGDVSAEAARYMVEGNKVLSAAWDTARERLERRKQ